MSHSERVPGIQQENDAGTEVHTPQSGKPSPCAYTYARQGVRLYSNTAVQKYTRRTYLVSDLLAHGHTPGRERVRVTVVVSIRLTAVAVAAPATDDPHRTLLGPIHSSGTSPFVVLFLLFVFVGLGGSTHAVQDRQYRTQDVGRY